MLLLAHFRPSDLRTLISRVLFIIGHHVIYSVDCNLSLWLNTDDSVS